MTIYKPIGALLATLVIAACAGPAPEGPSLEATVSKSIHVENVKVNVSAMGAQTEGRAVSAATVQSILQSTADEALVGAGSGPRSTEIEIDLSSVKIITSGQAFMLGGESIMKGQFRLRDSNTGEVLIPATMIEAGGGGWVLGGIVAAATLDDPRTELRELSQKYTDRIMVAVFGE
jgi:hypothetical protein